MIQHNTSKELHDMLLAFDVTDKKTFESGNTKLIIKKINNDEYCILTDKTDVCVTLTEEKIIVTKYNRMTVLVGCVQKAAQSFLYSLLKKIRRI